MISTPGILLDNSLSLIFMNQANNMLTSMFMTGNHM